MDFSAYLQSVIADYAKQRDRYTLTDLQVEYREEKGRSPDDPERQPEKQVERLEVLTGLRKYVQQGHVVLVGQPGSGKSTALGRLRCELAAAALADETQPVPVLVALRGLREDFGILEAIAFELQKGDPDIEAKDIRRLLLKRPKSPLFLLFDGINEIPSDDLRADVQQFPGSYANIPMIFTSRELGTQLGIEQKLEMCGLTERQMRSFVQKYLPDHAEVLLRQLKHRLRELAETPLLLKLLCDVFDPVTQQIPQSKGELFRAVDAKFNAWKTNEGVRTAEKFWQWNSELLQCLAFQMLQADGTPTGKWLQIERDRAEHLLEAVLKDRVTAPGEKAKDWLQDLLEHHLLQLAANPNQIEFHHQLFQEYYAAEYLRRQLPSLSADQLKRDYLNLLKWTEPLAVMLSLENNKALTVVEQALTMDLMLGARLAGETRGDLQNEIIELVIQRKPPTQIIGFTCSSKAVDLLGRSLLSLEEGTRWRAAEALGKIPGQSSVEQLILALDDEASQVVERAVLSLVEMDTESSTIALLNKLQGNNQSFYQRTIAVIKRDGSARMKSAIINYFEDAENHLLEATESTQEKLYAKSNIQREFFLE